jgi:hypothetical protein
LPLLLPAAAAIDMPWCETCSRFLNPNSLRADGTCPTCGRVVAEPSDKPAGAGAGGGAGAERERAPWHFKLLIAVTIVYLTWRIIQMIGWVIH